MSSRVSIIILLTKVDNTISMSSTPHNTNTRNATLSSLEKKRSRDRRAQKTAKDKRDIYIKSLEERVSFCDRHHGAGIIEPRLQTQLQTEELFAAIESLRRENEQLRARQEQMRSMMVSWEMEDEKDTGICLSTRADGLHSRRHLDEDYAVAPLGCSVVASGSPAENYATGGTRAATTTIGSNPLQNTPQNPTPAWSLTPLDDCDPAPLYLPLICPWLASPDLIATCPPEPTSPLDLLHGTRRNYLADHIHRIIRRRAFRDSECLALGWLVYLFSKWRVSPNPDTYARLAPFQGPIPMQLECGHPAALGLIIWPQMRANLIRNWTRYDFVEFAGYASCCVKVRWPWGKDVLERDADDNLRVRSEFLDVFTQESGWGVTGEFIEKYPELLEGMDVETVRFRFALPDMGDLSFQPLQQL